MASMNTFFEMVDSKVPHRYQKYALIFLVVVCLSLIIAVIILASQEEIIERKVEEEHEKVCSAPACITAASDIIHNMDPSTDPCEDFYQFACGRFINQTFIPDDSAYVNAITTTRDLVYTQIRAILEQPSSDNEIEPFTFAKTFYKLCYNTSAIEEDGTNTILEIVDSLGGWPVLEGVDWAGDKFDWKQAVYYLRNIGYSANYFIEVDIIPDLENTSRKVISIDQPTLLLPRAHLLEGLNNTFVRSYFEYMVDVAVLLGANRTNATEEMHQCLNFEREIANITLSFGRRENKSALYNPTTLAKLEFHYPDLNWREFIKYLLDIPNFELESDEKIIVMVPNYLTDIHELLQRTPTRVQANYILWRVVSLSLSYLSEDLRNRKLKYWEQLQGSKQYPPRWKSCLLNTLSQFWEPVRSLYGKTHFSDESKRLLDEIIETVEEQYVNIFEHTEFMDEKSRENTVHKAKTVKTHVSAFDLLSDKNLTDYYYALKFDSRAYLRAVLSASLFQNNQRYLDLRKPIEPAKQPKDISMEYGIHVPGGMYQGPYFHEDRPRYLNFGGIGWKIGHLLSHNYDIDGEEEDEDGNLAILWSNDTKSEYLERQHCFLTQYGNYTVEDIAKNVNGEQTLRENIADNGGIKVAYLAYNAWVEGNGPEPRLPGLDYTPQQLFWISAANTMCDKTREQYQTFLIKYYRNAPSKYRVIGSISNMEYFTKDFNCPIGSQMNPEKKCTFW